MKKYAALIATATYFISATAVMAQQAVPIRIETPQQGINPAISIGTLLSNVLIAVFVVAALAVLFMLVFGAFQWITSGGEKEAVGKARGRIMAALIGLVILAIAFLLTRVVGQIVNIDILNLNALPTLDACPSNQVFNPQTGGCVNPRTLPVQTP